MSETPATDDLSPIWRDYGARSDVMMVLFSGLKRRPEGIPTFSFQRVIDGFAVKKLYVRDLQRAWFLRGLQGVTSNVRETVEFFRREMAEQRVRRVVMTGYSLGGFAAMLFGHLLGADEVQAFSPQTFISLPKRWRHGDHRWQRWVVKLHCSRALFEPLDLKPLLARGNGHCKYILHYSRGARLDALHSKRVAGLPGVTLQEHESDSHRLVTELRDSGQLRALLEQSVRGQR